MGLGLAALLGACAASRDPNDLSHDPFAAQNRAVHETNKQLDAAVYGPVSRAYGQTVPQPVRTGITNLSTNWGLPADVIQYSLQGNGTRAADAGTRFLINTLFGLGGLIDPAKDMGLPYRETNFDETFYTWGIPEGGYVEIPAFGPGTQRDWTGWVLDQFTDPAYYVLPGVATDGLVALAGLDIVNDRYELDPVLEELLHNSTDSYTAQRISYLQNARARIQGGTKPAQLEDVYDGY